jgi:glycosyltransferase involved in cell wall biosynthesis
MGEGRKIKLIYDATTLSFGADKACFRSGIYFTAMNVLKCLVVDKSLDVSLYCKYDMLPKLELALENDFGDYSFNIISDVPFNLCTKIYTYLLKKRTVAKYKRKKLAKLFWDILVRIVKPAQKLQYKFYKKDFELKISAYEAIFSPVYKIPEVFIKLKKYTILHDVIPTIMSIYHPDSKKTSWYSSLVESLNGNDFYFSNSEHTRQDFLKYFPVIDENKIFTTLLACDESFKPCTKEQINSSKEKYNISLDKKYVFSLCTLEPRKNLVRAVKTFIEFIKKNNIDDMVFVLGGGSWKKFIGVLEKEVPEWEKYQDKILKIGYVDDEDLAPLYSGASWFVYTSQYEGFGLPPLEAMSSGCPVITSNNSSLPEVVGDAGIMIDWDSDEQHIQAYEKYYFDENLRQENSEKGLVRAKTFSWRKSVNTMIKIMHKEG